MYYILAKLATFYNIQPDPYPFHELITDKRRLPITYPGTIAILLSYESTGALIRICVKDMIAARC